VRDPLPLRHRWQARLNDLRDVAELPSALLAVGIDLQQISQQLEAQGVEEFSRSFESLVADIAACCDDR
jgi:transaldolase